jgi:hypothetical protein
LRLNKKWSIYGVIIGLIAALTALGIVQAQQMGEKSSLSEELDSAKHDWSMLEAEQSSRWQDDIDTQMDESQTNFNIAKEILSLPIDSIIANESLFTTAEVSSVILTSISVSTLTDDLLADLNCSYLPLSVTAEGDETALFDFISRLNTDLPNSLVRSVTLNIEDSSDDVEARADIELIIYTYQGE